MLISFCFINKIIYIYKQLNWYLNKARKHGPNDVNKLQYA